LCPRQKHRTRTRTRERRWARAFLPTNRNRLLQLLNYFSCFSYSNFKIARTRNGTLKVKGKLFRPRQHGAGNQTAIESDEEYARRLKQRFLRESFCGGIFQRQKLKLHRRDQNNIFFQRREFQFLRLEGKFGFLFRLFSGGNGFAKRAGMLAVESFCHCVAKRT
jgi:hypothetical protein